MGAPATVEQFDDRPRRWWRRRGGFVFFDRGPRGGLGPAPHAGGGLPPDLSIGSNSAISFARK
jgi:hypothetical protein